MLDKQTLALVITFLVAGTALGFSIFILVKAPQIFGKKKGSGDATENDEDKDYDRTVKLGRLKKKPVSLSIKGWDSGDTGKAVGFAGRVAAASR